MALLVFAMKFVLLRGLSQEDIKREAIGKRPDAEDLEDHRINRCRTRALRLLQPL